MTDQALTAKDAKDAKENPRRSTLVWYSLASFASLAVGGVGVNVMKDHEDD